MSATRSVMAPACGLPCSTAIFHVVLMLCLASLLAGCASSRKPILPRTGTIPLKVWVLLAPGEVPGDPGNNGCRLDAAQIQDHIDHLKSNGTLYGPKVDFTWDPSDLASSEIHYFNLAFYRTIDGDEFHTQIVANYWEDEKLNIYFTGNVEVDGPLIAGTIDPAAADNLSPPLPWILVNDGGFGEFSGFSPGFSPSDVISYNSIEHEITHYLGRFTSRAFGAGAYQRVYNTKEHANPAIGAGSQCILRDGGAPPAWPLNIPGRYNQTATERYEIWQRVYSGNWNNP